MSVVDHQPTPPHLVEVVPADSADDLMADVAAELAMLEEELDQLDAKATALEHRVAQSRWANRDDEVAGPLVRRVFESQAAATRAALTAALDEAVLWAEERVVQARAAADALVTERRSGWEPAPGAAPPVLRPADDARQDDRSEQPRPAALLQPAPEAEAPPPPDAVTTVMPVVVGDDPPEVALTDDESTAFGEFWVDDNAEPPARATSIIDVVLPLVALLIVVVVMLSWIG